MLHNFHMIFFVIQELELYKEELLGKPAILVINKMDLPEAQGRLRELEAHLENQEGRYTNKLFRDYLLYRKHHTY